MEKQFLLEIEEGVITVEVAIAKYAKLAQIQMGFIYDEDRIVHELVAPEDNPRLNLLLQILEEEVAGKAASSTGTGRCCPSCQGARRLRSGLDQGRHEAGRNRGAKGAVQRRSVLPGHPPAMRRSRNMAIRSWRSRTRTNAGL